MELTPLLEIVAIAALLAFILMIGFFLALMKSASKLLNETGNTIDNFAKSVTDSMDKINKDISELKVELVESLETMNTAVWKASETISSIHNEFDRVATITHAFEGLATQVYNVIAPPINKTTLLISALTKGSKAFKYIMRKR
jgi:methyl-accepting chemotaxis protein